MILVSGGTGFLGSAIVRALCARPDAPPVRVLSRDPQRHRARFAGLGVELVAGDVLRPATLPTAFDGVRVLVNAVQFPGYPVEAPARGLTFDRYDRGGTQAQVSAAVAAGVGKVVYVSGVGADAGSAKPWFRAKGQAEAAVRACGLDWTVLRPSWVYGPGDNSLNRFATIARRSPVMPVVVGDGTQRLQPLFVDDLAAVAAAAATDGPGGVTSGRVLEIGGPEIVDMDAVVRTMLDVMGKRRPLVHVPAALPRLGGRVLAALLPRPPLNADAVEFLVQDAVADLAALRETLDPALTPLRAGLATYLA